MITASQRTIGSTLGQKEHKCSELNSIQTWDTRVCLITQLAKALRKATLLRSDNTVNFRRDSRVHTVGISVASFCQRI